MSDTPYDSTADTQAHIERVNELLTKVATELAFRSLMHDASKLKEPEKSVFDAVTPKLKALTYGSPEYMGQLAHMREALEHHYRTNRHHPEFYAAGVEGMTLIDLVEMLCDWKAATERHADGDLAWSIEINAERFKIPPVIVDILRNTAKELKLL